MRILGYLPLDAVFKSALSALEARGHEVRRVMAIGEFRRSLAWADVVLMNYTKNDAPRYTPKVALSALMSALARRPLILFFMVDPLDLCDRPLQRAAFRIINQWITSFAALAGTLPSRAHILDRYGIAPSRRFFIDNLPNLQVWQNESESQQDDETANRVEVTITEIRQRRSSGDRTIHFLYHGELLWWHGLDLFAPVMEALARRGWEPRLIVAGHLYETSFRALGMTATAREAAIKNEIRKLLERSDVEWLGRVPQPLVRRLMSVCDYHVTQLRGGHIQAETELRTCLLEAMAAGMVCLHAPTRALRPGIFRDGENIVHLPRAPESATEAIIALRQNDERRRAIGRAAAETIIHHYDLNQWVLEFERLMQQSASASGRPR